MSDLLETLEIETAAAPRAAVIWMHGLGADGHDFEPIVPELAIPESLAIRFVFPHAPTRPVTINNGWVMRAWYDVLPVAGERREDEAGVRASQDAIEALIAREKSRGVPASRIVLAGFSQGGAMALHTGFRHGDRLAGIMGLSCFLPLADRVTDEATAANRDVPIFLAHGTHDDVIPIARGRRSRDVLLGFGYRIDWREYPMPHSVSPAEISDVAAWLRGVLTI
ncbi:MAG: alpha/beta hydrolase fold domain-containing protein [Candidatus Rokubacteria bacterium]|nr:alpha/beta hydrolase fold domain-containing protein [Candidatus Rokubacteria bacterium]